MELKEHSRPESQVALQVPVLFCDYLQPGEDAAAAADRIHWSLPCANSDPALVRPAAPSPYALCCFGHQVDCCRRCPHCNVMDSGNLSALSAFCVSPAPAVGNAAGVFWEA